MLITDLTVYMQYKHKPHYFFVSQINFEEFVVITTELLRVRTGLSLDEILAASIMILLGLQDYCIFYLLLR